MTVCTGRGDGADGGHCCWIAGKVCFYLTEVDGLPRCSKLLELGSWDAVKNDTNWQRSKVGQMFAERWPGYGCGDWPQNIPEVMARGIGLCCWRVSNGHLDT